MQPQPVVEPYIPEQSVIMQNEAFGFALGAAPNVLYGRYKQYGQVSLPPLQFPTQYSRI